MLRNVGLVSHFSQGDVMRGDVTRAKYFAYGSNLNAADFARWCNERGISVELRFISTAWLPDHELSFHYFSVARGGGALDIRPKFGSSVAGVLFEANDSAWAALDRKEGATSPTSSDRANRTRYKRIDAAVLTDDGREYSAQTYRVIESAPKHIPPTQEYLDIVDQGLRGFGLPTKALHEAAADRSISPEPRSIFVYGTLMRGGSAHLMARNHGVMHVENATVRGELWSLGPYPGMTLTEPSASLGTRSAVADGPVVHGERLEVRDIGGLLAKLDEYEDFAGYGASGSLYRRALVRAAGCLSWAYVYVGSLEGAELVPGGRFLIEPSATESSAGEKRS